jgi:hypothetical protein
MAAQLMATQPLAPEATRLEPIPAATEPVEPAESRRDGPFDAMRSDLPADATRVEPSATGLVPAAAQAQASGPGPGPGPGAPPPAPVAPRQRSGGGKKATFIIVVVLVALAAGGGAYALVSRSHGHATAQPSKPPHRYAHASAVRAPTSPTASASASPGTGPSASATPDPTQSGTVQVAAGVASNPAEPQVEAFVNRYFNSINTRNYTEYTSLFDAQARQSNSQSSFDSGFATTKDSDVVLTGIEDTGDGSLAATVSFTSRQNPADSVDDSACNDWQISLYLMPQGSAPSSSAMCTEI